MRRHRLPAADAEEVVQDAIRQFLEAGGIVDPGHPKDLLTALGSRINGLAVNIRRKKALLFVRPTRDGVLPDSESVGGEERVINDMVAQSGMKLLLERVEDDELLSSMVSKIAEGVEDPSELANVLGRDVHEVYNARRRLNARVAAVKMIMEGG